MRYFNQGSGFAVLVSRAEVDQFARRWPCSDLPSRALTFSFEANGDLVDIAPAVDGADAAALSQDAGTWGKRQHAASTPAPRII